MLFQNPFILQIFKTEFTDYELYQEFTSNWDVDFRMLSKSSFYAYLNMYLSDTIQLTRTKLNGKVDQYGLSPAGFRSIVIPVCKQGHFDWLGKKVTKNQLLIFPKNGTLDAVSFDGFDVFIVDVHEAFLEQTLESLRYKHAAKLFKGEEQYLYLDQQFAFKFHQLAENILQQALIQQSRKNNLENLQLYLVEHLISPLLKYINNGSRYDNSLGERRRDRALKNAVQLINTDAKNAPTISQLCQLTKVSERTLEYAFLEKYQMSPSEFIKATRLHKVRKELIVAREQNIKISTIASNYGFWHMGQFAADFKKQFGCLPSEVNKLSN